MEKFKYAANIFFMIAGIIETIITVYLLIKKGFCQKILYALIMSLLLTLSAVLEIMKINYISRE